MNKIKLVFNNSNLATKFLIVIACVYVSLGLSITTIGAVTEMTQKEVVKPIEVILKDGSKDQMKYLVNASTVEEILESLSLELNADDYINLDLTTQYKQGDIIEITRITKSEEKILEDIPYEHLRQADNSIPLFDSERLVQSGEFGKKELIYLTTYQNGVAIALEEIDQNILVEPISEIVGYSTVQQGAMFTGRLTSYGADCIGCSGRTAAGVNLIDGVNGSGSATYYYNGESYYVLAADSSIPFGTIIKVSNHNYSIADPFFGIVLDRGGDIKGGKLDLYYGSQNGAKFFTGGTSYNTTFEIISIGPGGRF
jgi:Uncharacterized protein conserved in bacteria